MDEALSSAWWCGLFSFSLSSSLSWHSLLLSTSSILFHFTFAFGSFILLVYWCACIYPLFSFYLYDGCSLSFWKLNEPTSTTHITTFMPEKWWTQNEWIWKSRKMHRISAPCRQYPKLNSKIVRIYKSERYVHVHTYIHTYIYSVVYKTSIVH